MRHRAVVLAFVAVTAASAAARASEPTSPPGPSAPASAKVPTAEPPARAESDYDRSPMLAGFLAVGTTVAGGLLISTFADEREPSTAASLITAPIVLAAPSAGHIYAGELRHAALTSLGRGLALGLMVIGTANAISSHEDSSAGPLVLGGAIYIGLTIYDWVDASSAVRRQRSRHRARAAVAVAPVVAPGVGGLSVGGSF